MSVHLNERKTFMNDIEALSSVLGSLIIKNDHVECCLNEVFQQTDSDCDKQTVLNLNIISFICKLLKCGGILLKYIVTCFFTFLFLYLFIISHNSVQKFIMRNCQNFIYPTMRSLRLWTLPLLQKYEFLSDWHEEDCLFKNPFYYELPLDCWPCEDIRTLVDLTGFSNYSSHYVLNEQPFIVRDSLQQAVSFHDLKKLYKEHNLALDHGTARFQCSEKDFCSPKDVFSKSSFPKDSFHVMWKINRVAAARVVRKFFPRPYFISNNSEVALERFLYLSGAQAPQFFLPLTEFANVWVAQGQGYRLIVLDPSMPCISNCSTVSVLLRPHDVLYYNWQFWRPRSRPANLSEDTSMTFVGSFY